MDLVLREAAAGDVPAIGEIVFTAFKTIADAHGFPPDLPSAEMATGLADGFVAHPSFYGVVAELDGRVVGSNFLGGSTGAPESQTLPSHTSRATGCGRSLGAGAPFLGACGG